MALTIDRNIIKSLTVLGYNFGIHILRSMIPKKKTDQAKIFIEYFKEDNITAFTPDEAADIHSFETCISCGICPAYCRVSELSGGRFLGPEHIAVSASRSEPEFFADADSIFRCAVCGQCEPVCPEDVPVSKIAAQMRSTIRRTRPDMLPNGYASAMENLQKHGNIYGESKVENPGLKKDADYILFLGCRERLDPARAERLFKLMDRLGVSFTCIDEVCCGGVPETMGLGYESDVSERILSAGPKKLLAACPHCAENLRKSAELEGRVDIKNLVEILPGLVPENLDISALPGPVAFHDPCHLGRGCGVIEEPREVLRRLGVEVVEMRETGVSAPCCGAGGGLALADAELAAAVARARIADAEAAGACVLATECLGCRNSLAAAAGKDVKLKVVLLTDLLSSLAGAKGA